MSAFIKRDFVYCVDPKEEKIVQAVLHLIEANDFSNIKLKIRALEEIGSLNHSPYTERSYKPRQLKRIISSFADTLFREAIQHIKSESDFDPIGMAHWYHKVKEIHESISAEHRGFVKIKNKVIVGILRYRPVSTGWCCCERFVSEEMFVDLELMDSEHLLEMNSGPE